MRAHLCTPAIRRLQSAKRQFRSPTARKTILTRSKGVQGQTSPSAASIFRAQDQGLVILLQPIHPLQAILLAGALPLFFGVLFGDLAYARSFEVQWKNFASWLLVGGLTMSSGALIWALVDFFRLTRDRGAGRLAYLGVLLAIWILGFVNALIHAGDAWASMPAGLVLAAVVAILAVAAVWLGFSSYRARVVAA